MMVITKLILSKYKCLSLNAIDYLELTPQHKIQLILGTNGSGKSRCLAQLTPLPASHTDFNKDGYKHIFIKYHNSQYELQNNFLSTGNKYHFIKDGEELNKGLTVTVYKELVQQEFGLTQDIHDLLNGINDFHSMTPAERRKWLTLISDSDYTYAFSYYNKLRDQLKDIQSTYKLNQSRLVQEKNKVLTPEQEVAYREELNVLKALISQLIELKQPLLNTSDARQRQLVIKEALEAKTVQVNTLCKELTERNVSIDSIDQQIIEAKSLEQSSHQQSLLYYNAIQTLEEQASILQHTAHQSYETIDVQLATLSSNARQLRSGKRLGLEFDNSQVALNALNAIQEQLIVIFSELPSNARGSFNTDVYQQTEEQYHRLEIKIAELKVQLQRLVHTKQTLEHARDHQQQSCPKCHHVWSKGYTEETYQAVLKDVDLYEQQIAKDSESLKSLTSTLDAHRARLSLIQQFRLLSYNWSVLEPLWAYMAAEDMVLTHTDRVINMIGDLMLDLQVDVQIDALRQEHKELCKLKAMTDANQMLDLNKINQQIEDHHRQLQHHSVTIKQAKADVVVYDTQKKTIIQLQKLQVELEQLLEERDTLGSLMGLSLKQQALNDTIRILQLELNQKEQLISKVDIQRGVIESIESMLGDLEMQQGLLKIAIKELSPTEGLIAKGLTSFINHFVKHINAFIAQIWLYPLELIPILPDENNEVDLDYRFSVRINDNTEIPDISKGSSAMKEIINLAFRVVSMSYLGLQDYPIMIDELGTSFDKAHREAAFHVIGNLLTNASFSQIFMVSHYEQQYGALTNADVSVLSASNISLPKDALINQCLIIR